MSDRRQSKGQQRGKEAEEEEVGGDPRTVDASDKDFFRTCLRTGAESAVSTAEGQVTAQARGLPQEWRGPLTSL